MRILFTGGSSFTGYWFAKELAEQGHEVVITLLRSPEDYCGLRLERINALSSVCKVHFNAPFGSESFLNVIHSYSQWDLLCHHAARVENYRNPQFDVGLAVRENTYNIPSVLEGLKDSGCRKIVVTGSVFEPGEGQGSDGLPAVSPYGLSKALTTQIIQYYAKILNLTLGKFVIPNPYGSLEEDRFTTYLAKSWLEGITPQVKTPEYIRDNIPVTLLARAYAHIVNKISNEAVNIAFQPSYYATSQGEFTALFAREMQQRFNTPCQFELMPQTTFSEPKIRINSQKLDPRFYEWNETQFWNELADFYLKSYKPCHSH